MIAFGEFVKQKRLHNRITLREFCRLSGIDPSNWSKIERGILPPPKSKTVLEAIAGILKIKKESEDWYTLMDLAAITHIPKELLNDDSIVEKLPVFFRTLRGQKPTEEELENLIKLIKES
ncbi:MAG: helix-turn-helix domain-containing protein [Candidatus Lokiarchaeota archaeon]|nr:helix-turn-helix domain-containing protein [Candidatus Lokiarchaeota archaeon]